MKIDSTGSRKRNSYLPPPLEKCGEATSKADLSVMDVQYLKRNVNDALTEALTSMVVSTPDDNIEYLGQYLTQFVARKASIAAAEISARQADVEAEKDIEQESKRLGAEQEVADKVKSRETKLATFCETLAGNFKTKQDCMDACTNFLSTYRQQVCLIQRKRLHLHKLQNHFQRSLSLYMSLIWKYKYILYSLFIQKP